LNQLQTDQSIAKNAGQKIDLQKISADKGTLTLLCGVISLKTKNNPPKAGCFFV